VEKPRELARIKNNLKKFIKLRSKSLKGDIKNKKLDHYGIVAGLMKEFRFAERVDALLGMDSRHKVTMGQRVSAMILNCLGFNERPLYLSPSHFERLECEALLGEGVEAKDLNAYSLSRALDKIAEKGVEEFFASIT